MNVSHEFSTENTANTIEHYAKDGGLGVVCPSCSFYHDPLRH